ncbi:hypothetical protein BG006_008290, partial [Podila minutissima]
ATLPHTLEEETESSQSIGTWDVQHDINALQSDEQIMAFLTKKRNTVKKSMKKKLQYAITKDIDLDFDDEYIQLEANIAKTEKQILAYNNTITDIDTTQTNVTFNKKSSAHHAKLVLELEKLKTPPTWEECEALFLEVIMDKNARIKSYENYYTR